MESFLDWPLFKARVMRVSLRHWGQRYGGFMFGFLALLLMLLGQMHPQTVETLRLRLVEPLVPALQALAQPAKLAAKLNLEVNNLFNTHAQNVVLRRDLIAAQNLIQQQAMLLREQAQLAALLNFQAPPALQAITVRVVGQSFGAYQKSLLALAGAGAGLHVDMAALAMAEEPAHGTSGALVGRVIAVANRVARILLLTDPVSRVPVRLASGLPAILAGQNEAAPILLYLPEQVNVAVGEALFTSGADGVLPPDLPVGVVSAVEGRLVRVQLYADAVRLTHVRLLSDPLAAANSSEDLSAVLPSAVLPTQVKASGATASGVSASTTP